MTASNEQAIPAPRPADLEPERALPENLGRNVFVNYAAVIVTSVTAIVTLPLMLNLLGADAYGIYLLAGSVVTYVQLLDLGFGAVTIKQVAADAYRRPESVVRTLNTNFFALSVLGFIGMIVGLGIAAVSPALFNVPDDLATDTVITVVILAISFGVSVPADILGGALAGYQRYDWLSISNVVLTVASSFGAALAVWMGFGLIGAGLASAIVSVSCHFLRYAMVRKLVPGLRLDRKLVDRSRLKGTTRESGWFLMRDITEIVINQADLVVVGIMLGPREVTIYAIGLKLAQLGRRAMKPLSQIFFPQASSLAADNESGRLGLLLVDGTRISMVVATPIALILSVLAYPLIGAWGIGDSIKGDVGQAVAVLVILALSRGLFSITETAWWLLAGGGWVKVTALVACVEAAVNLIASVALARPFGPAGVAAGTAIAMLCVGLPASLVLAGRLTNVPFSRLSRKALLPHVIPIVVVCAVLAVLKEFISHNAAVVVGACGLVFVGYVLLYVLLNRNTDESQRLRSTLQRLTKFGRRPKGRRRRTSAA